MRFGRLSLIAVAAVVGALFTGTPAQAVAPVAQRAALGESDTAILRYSDAGPKAKVAARRSDLRARLAALGVRPKSLEALPMVAVSGSTPALRAAAREAGVVAAHPDRELAFDLYQSMPLIFGGRQAELAAVGYDGSGVNIAIVDTGLYGLHRDLSDHVVENYEVVGEGAGATVVACQLPLGCDTDTNGHGSHVTGIAAGDGTESAGFYTGVAPEAGVVGYSVGVGPTILSAVSAYDHILAHPELGVVAVNSSFGEPGGARFDSADPVNQATKRLHDAGVTVVFSNGNSGANADRQDPPGASDCSTEDDGAGGRTATDGACVTNPYSVAPWVMSAAGGRKDGAGGPGDQHLSFYSSRGDPDPRIALSGETIDYSPTITAPGTSVRSVRDPTGDAQANSITGEPAAVSPPPGAEAYEAFYMSLTGTSMAAPHVTGAVAVVQSAAKDHLGRLLSPAEVEDAIAGAAAPMTGTDGFWDYPCGGEPELIECGSADPNQGYTGEVYERWQVGAGYLDVAGAVDAVLAMDPPAETGGDGSEGPGSGSGGGSGSSNPADDGSSSAGSGGGSGDGPGGGSSGSGGGGTGDDAGPRCVDLHRPAVRLRRARVRSRRGRLTIAGNAVDRGCGPAGSGRVRRVLVAVARGRGRGRCRFASRGARLGHTRRCRPPKYMRARGRASWRVTLKGLPRGRYLVWARAVDAAGNRGRREGSRRVRAR